MPVFSFTTRILGPTVPAGIDVQKKWDFTYFRHQPHVVTLFTFVPVAALGIMSVVRVIPDPPAYARKFSSRLGRTAERAPGEHRTAGADRARTRVVARTALAYGARGDGRVRGAVSRVRVSRRAAVAGGRDDGGPAHGTLVERPPNIRRDEDVIAWPHVTVGRRCRHLSVGARPDRRARPPPDGAPLLISADGLRNVRFFLLY